MALACAMNPIDKLKKTFHLTILARRSRYLEADWLSSFKFFLTVFIKSFFVSIWIVRNSKKSSRSGEQPKQSSSDFIQRLLESPSISDGQLEEYLERLKNIDELDNITAALLGAKLSNEQIKGIKDKQFQQEYKECYRRFLNISFRAFGLNKKFLQNQNEENKNDQDHDNSDQDTSNDKINIVLERLKFFVGDGTISKPSDMELINYLKEYYDVYRSKDRDLSLVFINKFSDICGKLIGDTKISQKVPKSKSEGIQSEPIDISANVFNQLLNSDLSSEQGADEKEGNESSTKIFAGKTKSCLYKSFVYGSQVKNTGRVQELEDKRNKLIKEKRIFTFFRDLRSHMKLIDLITLQEFIDRTNIFPGLIRIAQYSNNKKASNMLHIMHRHHGKLDLDSEEGVAFMKAMRDYESKVHSELLNYISGLDYAFKPVVRLPKNSSSSSDVYKNFDQTFTSYDINSANFTMLKIMAYGNIPVDYEWTDICYKIFPESQEYPYLKQLMTENKELRQTVLGIFLNDKQQFSVVENMMENIVITLANNLGIQPVSLKKDEIILPGVHNEQDSISSGTYAYVGFKRFCFTVCDVEYAVKLMAYGSPSEYRIVCPNGAKLRKYLQTTCEHLF